MRIEEIRDALRRQPFRQFAFRLADGHTLDVPHPEFVAIASPRMILVTNPRQDGSYSTVDVGLILSVDYQPTPAPPAAGDGQGGVA